MSTTPPVYFSGFRSALGITSGPVNFSDLYNISMQSMNTSNSLKTSDFTNVPKITTMYDQISTSGQGAVLGFYSLRKVIPTYTGPVINVRRSSDSVTADFFADLNGNLKATDGTKITGWLNGTTGYVTTWYDQSIYARHGTQATQSYQPWLALDPKGSGKYSIFFNGGVGPTGFNITSAAVQSVALNYYSLANPSLWQSFICTNTDNQGLRIYNNAFPTSPHVYEFMYPGGFVYYNYVKTTASPYFTNVDGQWNHLLACRTSTTLPIIHIGYPDSNAGLSVRAFNGYMSELQLFTGTVADVDVTALYYNIPQASWNNGLVGYYTGESWTGTQWNDISGNNNHATTVSGTITTSSNVIGNTRVYLSGTTTSRMTFPTAILPATYTMFYVAKYNNGARQRIFDGIAQNWLTGFWGGCSGVCWHNGWLTSSTADIHGYDWVLGTDQNSLIRTQGILRGNTGAGTPSYAQLSIMNGFGATTSEFSDWAVASVLVYNRTLTAAEIRLVEDQLAFQYKLPYPIQSGLVAGYDASLYVTADSTTWKDISPNGYNLTMSNTGFYQSSNGIPYMDFSSTCCAYYSPGNLPASSNATLVLFTTILNTTGDYRTLIRGSTTNNQALITIASGGNVIGMWDSDTNLGWIPSGYDLTTLPSLYDQFNMLVFKMSANTTPYWQLYVNNNPNPVGKITNVAAAFKGFQYIGHNIGIQPWGRIGTFLYYNRFLTTTEINEIYLRYAPRYKTQFFANVWLDASTLTGSVNSSVTTWANKGSLGSTYNATGTSITLSNDTGGNMVHFAGGGYALVPGTITWNTPTTSGITVICVARFTTLSSAGWERLIDFNAGVANNSIIMCRYGATSGIYCDNRYGGTVVTSGYSSTVDANFHVFSAVFQSGVQYIYVDAVSQNTNYITPAAFVSTSKVTSSNYIGKSSAAGDGIFTGDFRELITFNAPLSAYAIQGMTFSLQNKWGITSTLYPPVKGMQGPGPTTSGTITTSQTLYYGSGASATNSTFRICYRYSPGTSGSARTGSALAGSGYSTPSPITLTLTNSSFTDPQIYAEFTSGVTTADGIELVLQRNDAGSSTFYDVAWRSDLKAETSITFDLRSINLVTSGLIAYLDPAQTASYPGSGGTITNMVNNTTATLYGTYSYSNFALRFTNTSTNAALNVSYLRFGTLTNVTTVSAWVYVSSTPVLYRYLLDARSSMPEGHIAAHVLGTVWTSGSLYVNGGAAQSVTWANIESVGSWRHITVVANNPGTCALTMLGNYINNECWDAALGPVLVYNRAITEAENNMNYNYLKRRFV